MTNEEAIKQIEKVLAFLNPNQTINPAKWILPIIQKACLDREEEVCKRIRDWLNDPNREPANTKFTAGEMRNLASDIEFMIYKK